MALPKERFIPKDQLSFPLSGKLDSTYQPADKVWLWIDKDKHIEGHVQGVTFSNGFMVLYDIAVEIGDSGLYLVTYGIRGGMTKPGAPYPGDDGGLSKTEDTPYTNPHRTHH